MPKPSTIVLALALVAAALPAQIKQITCPPGNVTTEGSGYSSSLGLWANGRSQFVDGTCKGLKMVIRKMDFRLDNRSYITQTALGRTWQKVALSMCEQDFTVAPSVTFTKNCTTTPVTVFSGPQSWPTVVGTPKSPAPWGGGTKQPYSFPFSAPWLYSGSRRMVYDFSFQGGSLSNGFSWRSYGLPYYMDCVGYIADHGMRCDNTTRNSPIVPKCYDSGIPFPSVANADLVWCNYSNTTTVVAYRGKTLAYSRASGVAASAPLVLTWGLPQATPLNLGAACNLLYVKPVQYFFANATRYGTYITPFQVFKQVPGSYGITVACQAAWADSQTGQFSLTGAEITTLPKAVPDAINREKWSITSPTGAPTGLSVISGAQSFGAQALPKLDYN
jgi:hypothetical protein